MPTPHPLGDSSGEFRHRREIVESTTPVMGDCNGGSGRGHDARINNQDFKLSRAINCSGKTTEAYDLIGFMSLRRVIVFN